MDIVLSQINYLAVFVGGIIFMAVGAFWYSPIGFGNMWLQEMKLTQEDLEGKSPTPAMIKTFIAANITSFGLAAFLTLPNFAGSGWLDGLKLRLFGAIFIAGSGTFPNYAFEDRTLRHFLIHAGNLAVAMMLTGAMLAVWR